MANSIWLCMYVNGYTESHYDRTTFLQLKEYMMLLASSLNRTQFMLIIPGWHHRHRWKKCEWS